MSGRQAEDQVLDIHSVNEGSVTAGRIIQAFRQARHEFRRIRPQVCSSTLPHVSAHNLDLTGHEWWRAGTGVGNIHSPAVAMNHQSRRLVWPRFGHGDSYSHAKRHQGVMKAEAR